MPGKVESSAPAAPSSTADTQKQLDDLFAKQQALTMMTTVFNANMAHSQALMAAGQRIAGR